MDRAPLISSYIFWCVRFKLFITFAFPRSADSTESSVSCSRTSLSAQEDLGGSWRHRKRASTYNEVHMERTIQTLPSSPRTPRKRSFSFHEQSFCVTSEDESRDKCQEKPAPGPITLPPPCTCPYFGESSKRPPPTNEIVIVSSDTMKAIGNKNLDVSLLGDGVRSIGNRSPEMKPSASRNLEIGMLSESARPVSRSLEMGLLGKSNSGARPVEGANKVYEQPIVANSVVTWRSGRRGSSLGTSWRAASIRWRNVRLRVILDNCLRQLSLPFFLSLYIFIYLYLYLSLALSFSWSSRATLTFR